MSNLKILNKDFKLKKIYDKNGNPTNQFDRVNEAGDWVTIKGYDSYHNGVIISIMTIKGELKNNPLYGGEFGNQSWSLLEDLNNEMNRLRKDEYTRETLEKMMRTQKVEKVITTADPLELDPHLMKTEILVTTITDDTIPITITSKGGL